MRAATKRSHPHRASGELHESTIRPARRADTADLMRLIRAYYRFDHIRFVPAAIAPALERLLRSPSLGRVWLMCADGKTVGYLMLSFNFDLEFGGVQGYVTDLYLDEASRGKGLGRRALDIVDDYCRKHGIGTIELQVERANTGAQTFYRRLGFTRHNRIVMTREVRRKPSLVIER